jgi:lysophospholipase L1-like esterase
MRYLLTLAACLLTACQAEPGDVVPNGDAPPLRVLALGDSYTIGEGVGEDERWPVQLAALLRARGHEVDAPRIVARTGWTAHELARALARAESSGDVTGTYDLVTLSIGVNDQFRGHPVGDFPARFRALAERARELAGGDAGRVVVLSIPDYGVTPFGRRRGPAQIARELDAYNAVCREESQALGARFVDVTSHGREHRDDDRFVAGDGLHPSGAAYAAWAELALEAAEAALRSPRR